MVLYSITKMSKMQEKTCTNCIKIDHVSLQCKLKIIKKKKI